MFELLELILSILQDSFVADSSTNSVEVTPHNLVDSQPKPKILATSPSGDDLQKSGSSLNPKGDADICTELTKQVMAAQGKKPMATLEKTDEEGRKHVAFSGGFHIPLVGDKKVSGCV